MATPIDSKKTVYTSEIAYKSPRFSDVSIDSIILAFLNACIYDNVDTVFHLLSCHRFREIPGTILGDALQVGCKHKKHRIISIIIDSKLSDGIPQEKVYAAMTENVKLGELELVTLLEERFSSQNVRIECVLC